MPRCALGQTLGTREKVTYREEKQHTCVHSYIHAHTLMSIICAHSTLTIDTHSQLCTCIQMHSYTNALKWTHRHIHNANTHTCTHTGTHIHAYHSHTFLHIPAQDVHTYYLCTHVHTTHSQTHNTNVHMHSSNAVTYVFYMHIVTYPRYVLMHVYTLIQTCNTELCLYYVHTSQHTCKWTHTTHVCTHRHICIHNNTLARHPLHTRA